MTLNRIGPGKILPALAALLVLGGCVVVEGPGGPPGTVVLCHKGKKTMELPESAAGAHFGHGDTPGPCP